MIRKPSPRSRRGAAAVETALVVSVALSLIFGVFEFSRLFMVRNLLNNAAREGCRYAIANNTSATISTDVQTVVTYFMSGQSSGMGNFTVSVSGTHQGVSTAVNNLTAGDLLTVSVSGSFKFLNIIPAIKLPVSFSMASSVTMVCEGGM